MGDKINSNLDSPCTLPLSISLYKEICVFE